MDINSNLNIEQKQKRKLIMTQELKMSIKILQFSSLELKEFIEEEMKENPLLDLLEAESEMDRRENSFNSINSRRVEYENFKAYKPGLCEFLENQLHEVLNEDEYEIGKFIVGSLNENANLNLDYHQITDFFSDRKNEINSNDIKNIHSKILKLDIESAVELESRSSEYIEPDFIVKKKSDEFEIISNQNYYPGLRISSYYRNLLKNTDKEDTYEFLMKKYKSALWLIKSIEQRRDTIRKIIKVIIEKQHDFFENGLKYLYKMTMEEVAAEIEMHESTVSRASKCKYVQTPHGIFELKFFFNSGIGKLSSISIKAIINEKIASEDKSSPLSDSKLANKIKDEFKLDISRRTVAKYRNSLGIEGSRSRKIK